LKPAAVLNNQRETEDLPAPGFRTWLVALMLFASMTLNFVDRLVLANVAPVLRAELHLSNTQYSYIVFAFMAGMTLGQLPAGMFIDWLGARVALPTILVGWSLANMAHALARGVSSFAGLRFVMGLFECGNYSSALKVIGGLFPARQRAFALALMDSGSLAGSVIAPPLVVWILYHCGWRAAFFLPSLLAVFWLTPWFRIYRPAQPAAAPKSGAAAPGPDVRALLRRRQTWGVILMRAFSGPVSQFYWYWLPLYLVRGRGMSMAAMAALASLSYLLGGGGNMTGGLLSGWLIGRGVSINHARKLVFTVGAGLVACSALVPIVPSVNLAVAIVALAIFGLNFTSCNLIAIITDVFPESTLARITGLTGIGEGVVNMLVTLATGIVVDRFSFKPVFIGAGVMPLLSVAMLFILVGRIRKIAFA
jgi:ACS family hexuronate transporter-like MFS transporter